jgi:Rieske Fe-S protein
MHDGHTRHACRCAATDDRRDFLKRAAWLVAGAVTGLGVSAGRAGALPITCADAVSVSGSELTYPMPSADGATIDRDNGVIVVRYQGKVIAFNLSCPHENAAVRWKPALERFECSRHDSQYRPDGVYTAGRATRNMDRFAVKKNGSSLVVDVSRLIQSDQEKATWDASTVPGLA